jgi:hypothetical protein
MQASKRLFIGRLGSAVMLAGMTAVPAMAQDKAKPAAKAYERKILVDNAKVVVTENTFKPGGESDNRLRSSFRVVRVLKGGPTERTYADGKKEKNEWKTGEVRFVEPDKAAYKSKNIGKTDVVLYVVTLK